MTLNLAHLLAFVLFFWKAQCLSISLTYPTDCLTSSYKGYAEYFNTATLLCEECSQNTTYQRRSVDGLSCECQPGYRILTYFGGNTLKCEACKENETVTEDGLQCIPCTTGFVPGTKSCKSCPKSSVSMMYSEAGGVLKSQVCKQCDPTALPSNERCIPCSNTIRMLRSSSLNDSCDCPNTPVDGVCFPGITPTTAAGSTQLSASADSPVVPAYSEELNLIYPANVLNSANAISSYYFESQARSATAYCSVAYGNVTACQLLANLCTLQLQTRYRITVSSSSTCAEFIRLTNVRTHKRPGFLNWVTDMPWLYYNPTKASTALTETTISLQYRPGSNLDVRLATFSLEGRFLGFENAAENGSLQLCKETLEKMRAAFQFGTFYKTECEIKADDLFNTEKYPLIFYDPYLYFYDNRTHSPQMMPIPILNRALINSAGELVNMRTVDNAPWLRGSASAVSIEASIQEKWELTRRLFLVDNVVGRTGVDVIPTTLVRYASNIELIVTTRGIGSDGHIYPPMLAVDYANLYASEAYGKNRKVRVTFSVKYVQPMANEIEFGQNLRIALGVISAVATCYAMVRTWLWSRRAGVLRLDGMLIFKLLLFAAGSIANGFLTVIYGVAIYYIIFYKMQNVFVVTLPNSDQFLVAYIASAFALKTVDLVHLLAVQTTADVFFIDWERPQLPIAGQPRPVKKADGKTTLDRDDGNLENRGSLDVDRKTSAFHQHEETGVSIWRVIYVANEWNELQTHRKTNLLITLGCVLFFMHVAGIENYASSDPRSSTTINPLEYHSDRSRIFRIALILSIMLISGIIQWFLRIILWEKCFSDKLRSFADLCSVANVSVFIMSQANFGYYIHGHSPTGKSDVDLGGIEVMLATEIGGATPRRGITADSDEHTYRMALPAGVREALDRLYAPLLDIANRGASKTIGAPTRKTNANVYQALNRFLVRFISRDNAEGLRYRIVRRKALEEILDGEFDDTTYEGLFYIDDGNSFGDSLYYGNEMLLFTFDALLFCLVDLLSQNLILNAVITLIVAKVISLLRADLGRRNVAKKSMIDERFLL